MQRCRGAPGIVATLADLMPLEMALGGGVALYLRACVDADEISTVDDL